MHRDVTGAVGRGVWCECLFLEFHLVQDRQPLISHEYSRVGLRTATVGQRGFLQGAVRSKPPGLQEDSSLELGTGGWLR